MFQIREAEAVQRMCPLSFGPDAKGNPRADFCAGRKCMFWRFARLQSVVEIGKTPVLELHVDPLGAKVGERHVDPLQDKPGGEMGVCLGVAMNNVNLNLAIPRGALG